MRTIGVVTVARSDYGLYQPILRRIVADPGLRLHLIVAGMHLSPEFGETAQAIEEDGFPFAERVEMLLSSDSPEGVAKSIGVGVLGFAQAFGKTRPDILLVLGDRFEMLAAVIAALPFNIPVAHIHGGELTEGAIDDAIRHAITKMSHLHFAATAEYGRRIMQMGEEPWRVVVSGAPGLDNLSQVSLLDKNELARDYGLPPDEPFLLITYHPVTLEYEHAVRQVSALLSAVGRAAIRTVFTYPNADTSGRRIIAMLREFVAGHESAQVVAHLGSRTYFSMMRYAAAMIGNSSSGIVEAASFKLPVVNIGNRQGGRLRAKNVIDVGYSEEEILDGIRKALSPDFHNSLSDLVNPYGDGRASEQIVNRLKEVDLGQLITKHFVDAA